MLPFLDKTTWYLKDYHSLNETSTAISGYPRLLLWEIAKLPIMSCIHASPGMAPWGSPVPTLCSTRWHAMTRVRVSMTQAETWWALVQWGLSSFCLSLELWVAMQMSPGYPARWWRTCGSSISCCPPLQQSANPRNKTAYLTAADHTDVSERS